MAKVDGVGVAFCGGGFRSFAEVAAVDDMRRHDVKIGAVSGTSMGSLVAALVASGVDAGRISEVLIEMDQSIVNDGVLKNMQFKLLRMLPNNGILDSSLLGEYARTALEAVGMRTFADFTMPVGITAVDVVTGELYVFTNDADLFKPTDDSWKVVCDPKLDVARVCTCSGSYPLVITPTEYLGHTFMDGGCRMNLPTPLFDRSMVDAVVGVGLIRRSKPLEEVTPRSIAMQTMGCGANQLDLVHAKSADLYVNLPVSGDDAFQAGTGMLVIGEAQQMLRDNPPDWDSVKPTMLESVRRMAVDAFYNMIRSAPKGVGTTTGVGDQES